MKSFYNLFMRPLEKRGLSKAREELVSLVSGNALELGVGTGANLQFYSLDKINNLVLSDLAKSKHLVLPKNDNIIYIDVSVEELPFENECFDFVIHSLVFCSVNEVSKGLEEIKRVLKQSGKLLFIEHILPEKRGLRRIFKMINPIWRKISNDCQLNKDFENSLNDCGFEILQLHKFNNTIFISGIAQKK